MKKKILFMAIALMMVVACTVGGTLAWFTARTGVIKNTFTVGDINIKLKETLNVDNDGTFHGKMIPGTSIAKNPFVTVEAGSEDCWLFVSLEESKNFNDYLEYFIAGGWTLVTGETTVYWRQVNKQAGDQSFDVLLYNSVNVKNTVTNADISVAPALNIEAYAVQRAGINNVGDAWLVAKNSTIY